MLLYVLAAPLVILVALAFVYSERHRRMMESVNESRESDPLWDELDRLLENLRDDFDDDGRSGDLVSV